MPDNQPLPAGFLEDARELRLAYAHGKHSVRAHTARLRLKYGQTHAAFRDLLRRAWTMTPEQERRDAVIRRLEELRAKLEAEVDALLKASNITLGPPPESRS